MTHKLCSILLILAPLNGIASERSNLTSLMIPLTTVAQMEKIQVSPVMLTQIIQTGTRVTGERPHRVMYVCNQRSIGVVVNEITGQVTNVIANISAYEFLKQKDAADKKKRIKSKSL